MSIPAKVDTTAGRMAQFLAADDLDIDDILRRAGSGNMTIGSNLGAAEELILGGATSSVVRILGDMIVDGSSTVSTNETVTGTFNANGAVNLGDNSGDAIALGGGSTDTLSLNTDLDVGVGTRLIGGSVTNYLDDIWLDAVNANGPALAAYGLNVSGTNAGAYAIGVDPAILANSTATDLMTVLDDFDAIISAGGGETLQATYVLGNTISVTSGEGILDFSNDTTADTTTVLRLSRTPGSGTGGIALDVAMGANAEGDAVFINNLGSGAALTVQDGGADVFDISGAGAITATPTSGQNYTLTLGGAGVFDLTGDMQLAGSMRLAEEAGDPTNVANTGFLYTKDDGGDTELYYMDDGGAVIQITVDGAVNAASSLQAAYAGGNTIAVTSANGTVDISNDTTADTTAVLTLSKAPGAGAAGIVLDISTGANASGSAVNLVNAGTGTALFVNNTGTGDALDIQDGGTSVLLITNNGTVTLDSGASSTLSLITAGGVLSITSGSGGTNLDSSGSISIDASGASNFSTSGGNLTLDSISGELVFDDVGNSGLTLSDATDRVLDLAAAGEVFNGVTSVVGALSTLGRRVSDSGELQTEIPIENTVVVAAGDVIAASTVGGRVTRANANADTNMAVVGIAQTGGTGDAGGTILTRFWLPGSVVTDSGATFTPGSPLFAPDGTGRATHTAPANAGDVVMRIGFALTTTTFVFQPVEGFTL